MGVISSLTGFFGFSEHSERVEIEAGREALYVIPGSNMCVTVIIAIACTGPNFDTALVKDKAGNEKHVDPACLISLDDNKSHPTRVILDVFPATPERSTNNNVLRSSIS